MTPASIAAESEKLAAKFAVLKTIASDRRDLVEFLERHEKSFGAIVAKYGAKKVMFRGAATELCVWVRDIFPEQKKELALAELRKLDQSSSHVPPR